MYQKSFNIPQFNSIIDNAIKEYAQEKRVLENDQKRVDEKIDLLKWAKECIDTIQKKLSEAYQQLNQQEHDLAVLEQQLKEEREQREEHARLDAKLMDLTEQNAALTAQIAVQQEMFEKSNRQLVDEKRQREELEMKLAELNKLSAGMAKKASEEAMLKVLRTYANTSKRKTMDKRTFAKTAILELANVNGLVLPDDLAATIESLDFTIDSIDRNKECSHSAKNINRTERRCYRATESHLIAIRQNCISFLQTLNGITKIKLN